MTREVIQAFLRSWIFLVLLLFFFSCVCFFQRFSIILSHSVCLNLFYIQTMIETRWKTRILEKNNEKGEAAFCKPLLHTLCKILYIWNSFFLLVIFSLMIHTVPFKGRTFDFLGGGGGGEWLQNLPGQRYLFSIDSKNIYYFYYYPAHIIYFQEISKVKLKKDRKEEKRSNATSK